MILIKFDKKKTETDIDLHDILDENFDYERFIDEKNKFNDLK